MATEQWLTGYKFTVIIRSFEYSEQFSDFID
jgi:hypothetical protein